MSINSNTKIAGKFTRLYITALSTVALLSIGGQILIQIALNEQSNDSRIVNIAGRQRMLSQKICKNVILLSNDIDKTNRDTQKKELDEALFLWHTYHRALQSGNLDTLKNKINNSDHILFLFKQIEPHFLTIYNNAYILSNASSNSTPEYRNRALTEILKTEKLFLREMDKIVSTYAQEAKERVDTLKEIELLLLGLTLVILILEGLFVFRPAVSNLHKTMLKLIESESKAIEMNKKLSAVNSSLRLAEEALLNSTNEKHKRQMNEQKIRSSSLVEGQENERKRIAQDIHDGIGQMLTALKLNIESIAAEQLTEKEKIKLEEAGKLTSKTIAEIRTITFNLMPNVLSDFGIVSAMKQLIEQASRISGTSLIFTCPNSFNRLDKNIEIGLYRISQEAINNAVKYAQAKEISIELLLNDNYIYLNIKDNGKGFNNRKANLGPDHKKISNGIYNMEERTNLMDGEFKITSMLGEGTKIEIKIPVKYQ